MGASGEPKHTGAQYRRAYCGLLPLPAMRILRMTFTSGQRGHSPTIQRNFGGEGGGFLSFFEERKSFSENDLIGSPFGGTIKGGGYMLCVEDSTKQPLATRRTRWEPL